MAGTFKTRSKSYLNFALPELNPTATIRTKVHITENMQNYDMIIGRDLLHKLGFILDFKDKNIEWNNTVIAIKSPDSERETHFSIEEPAAIQEETERMKKIWTI